MSSSSSVGLLVSLGALGVYGYSAYYMNSDYLRVGMKDIIPAKLRVYGQLKFLTYQCLLIQLLSALLHVLAHFVRPLRGLRDVVFSTLAFPVGSIVVLSFWAVWFIFGRESIFPAKLDPFYPPWLNHATHTIIVPINLILAIVMRHKYSKNGVLLTILYTGAYTVFLHVIKAQTGLFVYGYLNEMSDTERSIYFASTGLFAYLLYKTGQMVTNVIHRGRASSGSSSSTSGKTVTGKLARKQQQKQK